MGWRRITKRREVVGGSSRNAGPNALAVYLSCEGKGRVGYQGVEEFVAAGPTKIPGPLYGRRCCSGRCSTTISRGSPGRGGLASDSRPRADRGWSCERAARTRGSRLQRHGGVNSMLNSRRAGAAISTTVRRTSGWMDIPAGGGSGQRWQPESSKLTARLRPQHW